MMAKDRKLATLCAHAGALPREAGGANAPFIPPIVQTTLFNLGASDDAEALFTGRQPGYTYTRFGNPTVERLAETVAQLEGGAGAAHHSLRQRGDFVRSDGRVAREG